MTVSAIVLASGYSRRLDTDKLLVDLGGMTVIRRVVGQVVRSRVDETILVYREAAVVEAVRDLDIIPVFNGKAHLGMSASLKAGIDATDEQTGGYLFFVGDQIFLRREVIDQLLAEIGRDPGTILIPRCSGRRTNPVYFPKRYREQLLEITGDEGGRQIIRGLEKGLRFIDIEEETFCLDLDTPEDLERARRILRSRT